ncbi:MAG: hypothetical protein IPN83_26645 [Holophagales bacterium]|nr:hypothetical protein [Holophagales bacterium]
MPTPPDEYVRGAVLATLISRVSTLPPIARWTVAIGTATFVTMPPETPNRVTAFAWCMNSAFLRGSIRTDLTFVPTNRLVGTKTYCDSLTTTALPE